ncbi:MAG: SRPBCC domain-containing protein [Armatimonadota bacterium]
MTVTKTVSVSEPEIVRVERLLPHPPRRVWRALTEKDAIEKWLLPIAPSKENRREKPLDTPGDGVTLSAAPAVRVAYEVADASPERNLSLWWRVQSLDTDETVTTRVTWTLTPEQDGAATRLVIEHKPFGVTALAMQASAPLNGVMARFAVYLELGRTHRRAARGRITRNVNIKETIRCQ